MTAQEHVPTTVRVSMAEFVRLYDREGPFELIEGERIPVLPGAAEHSEIIKLLYDLLLGYERTERRIVTYSETPYVLVDTPDWVRESRVPDVMAYEASRMAAYKAQTPDWKKKPFILVPDLCIEVISPNDQYVDVDEKVDRYLSDGVRLIWVLNPRTNRVIVQPANSNQSTRLGVNDTLDGGDVLPGFTLPVSEVFST